MSTGDIFVDGNPPPPISGQAMCEYVIAAGLYHGTPEQLWNHDAGGHLITPHELYWEAMAKNGHKIEIELPNGKRVPYYTQSKDAAP